MKSALQSEKECYLCKSQQGLERHHCLHGTANRKNAERRGLTVWLCQAHHRGNSGVHMDSKIDTYFKRLAQTFYEQNIGTRDEFRREFGKSWL